MFYRWIHNFSSVIAQGELLMIPVLFLLFLFWKSRKGLLKELLVSYNYLKFFLLVFTAGFSLLELYLAWSGISKYEYDIFFKYRVSGSYQQSYWIWLFGNLLLLLLLLFRKIRTSVFFSLILYVLSNLWLWLERFFIFISSSYRDFMPSSWQVQYNWPQFLISPFVFIGVLVLVYFLRKKLAARIHIKKN